jgi:predicted glycosyltransferase
MVDTLREFAPDVVITELFPFGRRSLSAEFLGLLQATENLRPKPLVLASVRDILAPPSKPAKAVRADEILMQHYDGVLVHSDPTITELAASWPVSPALRAMLKYTGYVAQPPALAHPTGEGAGEVLVSAGGGSVGQALFEAAVEAARGHALRWRLLVGGADGAARIAALQEQAAGLEITIEPVRPDFRQMLTGAAASVSMCGYNTALDLLQTGVPAVLMPFDDGGEVEQSLRAASLAAQGGIEVVTSADLTPARLVSAVTQVLDVGQRSAAGLQMLGAEESVRIVEAMMAEAQV